MRASALILCAAISAWAQSGVSEPRIGMIRDTAGLLRPVSGIAGNFVVRDSLTSAVSAFAFSGQIGIAKLDASTVVMDASGKVISATDSPSGPAVFGFSPDGTAAIAYYALDGSFARWLTDAWTPLVLDPQIFGGALLSINTPDADHIAAVVQHARWRTLLRVRISDNAVESSELLPGTGDVLLCANGSLISAEKTGIIIRDPNAIENRLAVTERVNSLAQMGTEWVQVGTAGGRFFALRIRAGSTQIFALPGVAQ